MAREKGLRSMAGITPPFFFRLHTVNFFPVSEKLRGELGGASDGTQRLSTAANDFDEILSTSTPSFFNTLFWSRQDDFLALDKFGVSQHDFRSIFSNPIMKRVTFPFHEVLSFTTKSPSLQRAFGLSRRAGG